MKAIQTYQETETVLTKDSETQRIAAYEGPSDSTVFVRWESKSPWVSGEQSRCVGVYQTYGTACRELRRRVNLLVANGWAEAGRT